MLLTAGNVFCIDCVCMGICTGHELSSRSLDLRQFYIMMAGRISQNSLFNSCYLWRACRDKVYSHNKNKISHILKNIFRKKHILLFQKKKTPQIYLFLFLFIIKMVLSHAPLTHRSNLTKSPCLGGSNGMAAYGVPISFTFLVTAILPCSLRPKTH